MHGHYRTENIVGFFAVFRTIYIVLVCFFSSLRRWWGTIREAYQMHETLSTFTDDEIVRKNASLDPEEQSKC